MRKLWAVLLIIMVMFIACVPAEDEFLENDNRFVVLYKEGSLSLRLLILLDSQTGVEYLFVDTAYGAGLTPMLESSRY